MSSNCQQTVDELKEIQKTKVEFDAALKAKDFEAASKLQRELEDRIRWLDLAVDNPVSQFRHWAKEHGLEGKAERIEVTIGGEDKYVLRSKLRSAGIEVGSSAEAMIMSDDFKTFMRPKKINLVRLSVKDLGFFAYPDSDPDVTMLDVYRQAYRLGLAFCPGETAVSMGLECAIDGLNHIAMDPIFDGQKKSIFIVGYNQATGEKAIHAFNTDRAWHAKLELIFRLPAEDRDWM